MKIIEMSLYAGRYRILLLEETLGLSNIVRFILLLGELKGVSLYWYFVQ